MDPQKQPFSSSNNPLDGASDSPADAMQTPADAPTAHDMSSWDSEPKPSQVGGGAYGSSSFQPDVPDSSSSTGSSVAPDAVVIDSTMLHPEESKAPIMPTPAGSQIDPAESMSSPTPVSNSMPGAQMPTAGSNYATPYEPMPQNAVAAGTVLPAGGVPSASGFFASDAPSTGAMPAGTVVAPRKSKKKMIIVLIVAAIVVVLLGASAAAYYVAMNKPQNILDMALSNTTKTTSTAFEGSVNIDSGKDASVNGTFTGAADQNGVFTLNAKIDALLTTISIDTRSADGKTFYARVSGLDGLGKLLTASGSPTAEIYAPIISGLDKQWIQVNQSMIKQLTGRDDASVGAKMTAEDRQKLVTAYKKNEFLVVQKSLATEDVKGSSSYHFQVGIDKTKMKSFVAAVKSAKVSNLTMTDDDIQSFNKLVDKTDFSKYPLEIWVSKSDKRIDQISFAIKQDGTKVSVRYTVDSYNKPVNVVVPTGAKSLLTIISNLFGGESTGLDSLTGVSL
ncbi:MAG TPA: hypothetical protein VLH38_05825 [Patescibacteria group bacterium]|nr:hypothetical protein [Patescibacteria group bacterium]